MTAIRTSIQMYVCTYVHICMYEQVEITIKMGNTNDMQN